ncbi:MAG: DedA family protein [Polyangiaceae bacterium]|nr:DedA family protein [Polyangiaceae bacterium]
MDALRQFIDIMLHLDKHLNAWAGTMGGWLYALLFVVIFCETGLVVTPFLPGDSLLFAVGALAATEGSPINVAVVIVLLFVAGVLGDAVNYSIGKKIGPRAFKSEKSWLLNKKHLEKTQAFYEKHGGKTIIIARFMPIIRTFAPFVAGIGQMRYRRFAAFNVIGAALWVVSFTVLGYAFGTQPIVKKNFTLVIAAIIVISVMPGVIEFLRAWRQSKSDAAKGEGATKGGDGAKETEATKGAE